VAQVGGEFLVSGWRGDDGDDGLGDGGVSQERGLDLAGLDPDAADLDLAVDPAGELQRPVRAAADQVTALVQPPARNEGVRDEPSCGQRGPVQVTPSQAGAAKVEFSEHPDRYWVQVLVQDVGPVIRANGEADRRRHYRGGVEVGDDRD